MRAKNAENLTEGIVVSKMDRLFEPRQYNNERYINPVNGYYVSGERVSGDCVSGDPVSGDRVSGDRVSGDPVNGDRVSGAA